MCPLDATVLTKTPSMNVAGLLVLWICLISTLVNEGNGLQCFECNKVEDRTQCNNETQCGIDENCFIERYGNLPYATFKLGCIEHERCPAQPLQEFTLVRRDLRGNPVPECRKCCTTDNCNANYCDFKLSAPSSTASIPCTDKESDCRRLNQTVHVCRDVQNAKRLCRKYCGLCNLVDGSWNVWSDWSMCDVSCSRGTVSRKRICNNPAPANGGLQCSGNNMETKSCKLRDCPVHGGWGPWQSWDSCNTQCGMGLTKRRRTCTSPTPTLFGNLCFGDDTEIQLCNGTNCSKEAVIQEATPLPPPNPGTCLDVMPSCDLLNKTLAICADSEKARALCQHYCNFCGVVDGHWTNWSDWVQCSVTCGNGTTSRSRSCTNPSPANGGLPCTGQTLETKVCNKRECPVHGGWAMWGLWTTCTATCGTGLAHRRRNCNNPTPSLFGANCYGDATEFRICVVRQCPVDGKWNTWTSWSICSSTCGNGTVSRTRDCNNPEPLYGGVTCTGNANETQSCQLRNCPVNGRWSGWTSWGSCSATCGKGLRKRTRNCNSPTPAFGGNFCFGDSSENELCQNRYCPTVSFTVNLPSSRTYSSGQAIIFTTIVNNDGGGYSSTTGQFTAPTAGKYLFSLTVMKYSSFAQVILTKNNIAIGYVSPSDDRYGDTASVSAAVYLNKGDTVWAKYGLGPIYNNVYTSFTGVLIHP